MTRKSIHLAVLCLLLGTLLCLGAWSYSASRNLRSSNVPSGAALPTLVLPTTTQDLGTVEQGDVLNTRFRVTNQGSRRLILFEAVEGCCEELDSKRRIEVPPGQSTWLDVEVDTTPWHGEMDHSVHFTTNDPATPQFTLRVAATVR